MATDQFLLLPLEVQVALGGGYLAYAVAYAGLDRRVRPAEMAFRVLAFGLVALISFKAVLAQDCPPWAAALTAVLAATIAGALWRRFLRHWVLALLDRLKISSEDGLPDAWTALIQARGLNVTQLSVHLTDGRVLFHERSAYGSALHDGLYLGRDGSIVMVVEETLLPDGKTRITSEDIAHPDWGTRLTYIPASQIARVTLRTPTLS